MNREIKFRGWNKSVKKMIDLKAITPLALDSGLKLDGLFLPFTDDIELLQYIGLKDKNGNEIYEGDIVIFDDTEIGGQRYTGEVQWNDDLTMDSLCFGLWTKEGWLSTNFLGELEIIGNVFENPELLK